MLFTTCVSVLLLGGRAGIAEGPVTLKFQPPIGQTYKYRMTMKMSMSQSGGKTTSMPPMTSQTSTDMDMTAVSRSGDVTTMKSKVFGSKTTLPPGVMTPAVKEQMAKASQDKTMTSKIDSHYHVSGMSGSGVDQLSSSLQNMAFPTHPVKVGGTWSTSLDMDKFGSAMMGAAAPGMKMKMTGNIPIKFTLKSVSHRGGKSIADLFMVMTGTIHMSISGQNIPISMTSAGDILVDLATGMTVSMKVTADSKVPAGGMTMTQHMVQTMVAR